MKSAFSWVTAIFVAAILPLIFIRVLLTPIFPQVEYRLLGFPEDSYGFTLEDRLHWAPIAIEYLLNDAGPEFLADLRFEDGSAVFNEREVSHMLDVKIVVTGALMALRLILLALVLLALLAWRFTLIKEFMLGIQRGGQLIFWLILGIGAFAAISFNAFFTAFHGLFFTGDSWLFYYSDTLIRLFPIRFWQDASLIILGGSLLCGLFLGFLWKPKQA